ncbi:MAG TPA: ABC transporter ATP-binding protein [Jiangellaceae bacterium]
MNPDLTNGIRSGTTHRTVGGLTPGGTPRATGGIGTLSQGSVAAAALGVSKTYGAGDTRVLALDDVTLEIPSGSFVAIMGPSGSGKSTLLHCLAGLDTPTSGRVFLGDTDLTGLHDTALTLVRRRRIGFVFQSFYLLPTLDAHANIELPLHLAGQSADPVWFDHVVEVLGLGDRLTHRPSELSGGQQQRVAVARALVSRPDVVFADEPTGNLDSRSGAELLAFLRASVRELGQTVVVVTHDPSAAAYADRVVLLADGALAGEISEPTADSVLAGLRGLGA